MMEAYSSGVIFNCVHIVTLSENKFILMEGQHPKGEYDTYEEAWKEFNKYDEVSQ